MSRKAVELLRSLGFEAASLTGGIRGWGAVWSEAAIPWRSRDGELLIQFRRNGKGCLSYLIGAGGEAAVVDPSIDVSAYREAARRRGLRITHVLETHVHADHISRARELCEIEGAKLVMPPNRRVTYPFTPIRDGETLSIGGLSVEAVATPGHTSESVCYRVGDQALLTGDTLFVESVGRPDLERGDAGAEAAARMLYRSLRERLLGRFDGIGVYPAHTGRPVGFDGQPIGASLTELRRELAWLGYEEKEFVDTVLASLQAKPPNFLEIISINEGKAGLAGKDPLDVEAGPNRCAAG